MLLGTVSVTSILHTTRPEGPKIASIPYFILEESALKDETTAASFKKVSRSELIDLLNQDLSREYQAIIGYVVYSQVLKGAEFMNIAGELETRCSRTEPRPDHRQAN